MCIEWPPISSSANGAFEALWLSLGLLCTSVLLQPFIDLWFLETNILPNKSDSTNISCWVAYSPGEQAFSTITVGFKSHRLL